MYFETDAQFEEYRELMDKWNSFYKQHGREIENCESVGGTIFEYLNPDDIVPVFNYGYYSGYTNDTANDYLRIAAKDTWIRVFENNNIDYIHVTGRFDYHGLYAICDTKEKLEEIEYWKETCIQNHDSYSEIEYELQYESLEESYEDTLHDYEFTGDKPTFEEFYNAYMSVHDYCEFGYFHHGIDPVLEKLGYVYEVPTEQDLENEEYYDHETWFKPAYTVRIIYGDSVTTKKWFDATSAANQVCDLFSEYVIKPRNYYRVSDKNRTQHGKPIGDIAATYRMDTLMGIPFIVEVIKNDNQ